MLSNSKEAFVEVMNARNISRPLVVFFAIFQFLYGFNFGFVKQMNKYKAPAQSFSAAMGIIISAYGCYSVVYNVSGIIYSFQYFLTFLILFIGRYTLYEFMSDLSLVKIEFQQDFFAKNNGTIVSIYVFIMFWSKLVLGVLYHWNVTEQGPFIVRFFLLILVLGLDAIPAVNSMVFYNIFLKIRYLCTRFSNNNIGVIEVQEGYKSVLDLLDKIKPTADHLIVLGFITDCPKWILTIWYFLILHKQEREWSWTLGCSYAYALHLTLHIILPAVCAELMQARADELTLLLQERLLLEQDECTRAKLTQLARYIRARPPLRKSWRLLPLGLQLPIAMLSICATQLIVIIQFTHLYD